MIKFLKTYFPMVVSIIFFFIYSLILAAALFYNDFLGNEISFAYFLIILTIVIVIVIWGEIIYFIVKAANNKALKNNVLWCFLIYLFNVFVIPYYNLKYVIGDSKTKIKMVIFILLSIISLVVGALLPSMYSSKNIAEPFYIYSDDEPIRFKFNGSYNEREVGEYDLYVSDALRQINMGIFVYEEDEHVNPSTVMELRDSWVRTSRNNVTLVDEYIKELDDKIIFSKVYFGDKEGERFVYKISTVSFTTSNVVVNFIQVCFDEDYAVYKNELEQVLLDVEYIGSKEL